MPHVRNFVFLDDFATARVTPDAPRIAVHQVDARRLSLIMVKRLPLSNNCIGVGRIDSPIVTAMPHGDCRPWGDVTRSATHQCGKLLVRRAAMSFHAIESCQEGCGATER